MDYLPVFLDLRDQLALVRRRRRGGGPQGGAAAEGARAGARRGAAAAFRAGAVPRRRSHRAPGLRVRAAALRRRRCSRLPPPIAARSIRRWRRPAPRARIFVNVVDDGARLICIMPAIVDRSPLIVAIGTSGQSPTLARRVRAQLEALLPERTGRAGAPGRRRARAGAARAAGYRAAAAVLGAAVRGQHRQQGARRAARARPQQLLDARTAARAAAGAPRPCGEVYLIGAGPGDPDLLTLRALQLLQQADVRAVRPTGQRRRCSSACGATPQRIFVGKESGQHRVTQERIHALLLEHAGRGLRVARLKGGDPFIFGRGGEEIEVLQRAGIPVIVVPGITAALGAAAARGAAADAARRGAVGHVRHRDRATGAERLDWRALAAPRADRGVLHGRGAAAAHRRAAARAWCAAPSARPRSSSAPRCREQRVIAGTPARYRRAGAAARSSARRRC